jgi:GNAT superfamily N-acetyltransferase
MRQIRSLSEAETARLVDWARDEGWNPAPGDAEAFYAADPFGMIGAFVDGEMAAGVAAIRYGQHYGFIGLYIAAPKFRGQGHGRAVWDAGMAWLHGRTVGLDGVPAQQANYAQMGFVAAYPSARFAGRPIFAPGSIDGVTFRPPVTEDFAAIAALDRRYFPEPRDAFLKAWLAGPRRWLLAFAGEQLVGMAALRPCAVGAKFGPLVAETDGIALDLIGRLASHWGGEIQIDAPLVHSAFIGQLEAAGMVRSFETARMYRGPAPASLVPYGVTTLELG